MLRTADGREVLLGTGAEFQAAVSDIVNATGGSSGRGAFSRLFGLQPEVVMAADEAARLGDEAAQFKLVLGDRLRVETVALLDRLSVLQP